MDGVLIRSSDPAQGAIYYNSTTGKQTPLNTGDALNTLNAAGTNEFAPAMRNSYGAGSTSYSPGDIGGAVIPGAFRNFNSMQAKDVGGYDIPTASTHYVTTPTGRFLSGGAGPDTTISANAYGYDQASSPFSANPGIQTDKTTGQQFINPTSAQVMPGFWMQGGGAADVDYAANRNALRNAFNGFQSDPQQVKNMMDQYNVTPEQLQIATQGGAQQRIGGIMNQNANEAPLSAATGYADINKYLQDNAAVFTPKVGMASGGSVPVGGLFTQHYGETPAAVTTAPVDNPANNIRAFWNANQSNPQAIISEMKKYGVSTNDLASAIGESPQMMAQWFQTASAQNPSTVSRSVAPLGPNDPGYAAQQAQFAAAAAYASNANANATGASNPGSANVTPPDRMTSDQNTNISAFWNANRGNPQIIKNAMSQYGVSSADLARATGQTDAQIAAYLATGVESPPVTQATDAPSPFMTPEQNTNIAAFWKANSGNPQAIISAMQQYGVSANDLALATGQTPAQIAAYLSAGGAASGFGGTGPSGTPGVPPAGSSDPTRQPPTNIGPGGLGPVSTQTPGPLTTSLTDLGATPWTGPIKTDIGMIGANGGVTGPGDPGFVNPGSWNSRPSTNPDPMVSGVSTGAPTSNRGPLSNIWNPAPTVQGGYNTPVLDSLYSNMQQGFGGPKPNFNFQSKPGFKSGGVVGALTRVIKHGI
jgi:antitoxin component HigA of HigAB toxin-antitoxin module